MKGLLDHDGENMAVRMFLSLYANRSGLTTRQMQYHLGAAGFNGAWPAWVSDDADVHLNKWRAQNWLRHLFDLEKNIDTSEERVHVSDKNVHVAIAELTRERDDALRLLAMAHLNLCQHLEYGFNPKTAQSTLISVGQIAPLLHEAINKESTT
jgi:hypothetical protein